MKNKVAKCLIVLTSLLILYNNPGHMASINVSASETTSGQEEGSSGDSSDDPGSGAASSGNTGSSSSSTNKKRPDTSALEQSIKQKQGELSQLEKEKKSLQQGKTNIQNVIKGLQNSKNQVSQVVAQLDTELTNIQNNIDTYNGLVDAKKEEIVNTTAELETAIETENQQYEAMKKRIKFMYESGDSMYIDMLVTAESFGDMLNKADYIEQLSAYDRNQLEEYRLTVAYTEECKKELEAEQEVLESAVAAAEEEQNNMNALIAEKKNQIEALENDIDKQEETIAEYEEQLRAQTEVIQALEAAVAAEKEALAEASRITYDGGMFTWPAPSYTRISSEYGNRTHPTLGVSMFHAGLDMAAPGGSPILAAYSGQVCATGYSGAMGNYAMIDHGSGLYTVYMHASSISVSKGQSVSAGQRIGSVGSTGRSTGNHLHFGVRLNGQYVNPRSYL